MLHGMVGVVLLGLVGKLHNWDDSAMFFDGSSLGSLRGSSFCSRAGANVGSIGVVVFGLAVYITVVIPTLRTIVTPLAEETRQDRIEAMTVLSAANIIIMVCLGLVLLLQVRARVYVKGEPAEETDMMVCRRGRSMRNGQTHAN
jgi:Ca2+/H+ antiporter